MPESVCCGRIEVTSVAGGPWGAGCAMSGGVIGEGEPAFWIRCRSREQSVVVVKQSLAGDAMLTAQCPNSLGRARRALLTGLAWALAAAVG